MFRFFPVLVAALGLAACTPAPQGQFVPSRKSAVELRTIEARRVPADADTTMRGVIATLQDLGYRITRVESEARTVSGTRATTLRLAVVVQPHGRDESVVRANAVMIGGLREAQVDSAEFYQKDFFEPLAATMQRQLAMLGSDDVAPEAAQPVAERASARPAEASAPNSASAASSVAPAAPSNGVAAVPAKAAGPAAAPASSSSASPRP